ncbi:MAG: hypothetical protein SGCHY_000497 [Lobulomycetales sp.]
MGISVHGIKSRKEIVNAVQAIQSEAPQMELAEIFALMEDWKSGEASIAAFVRDLREARGCKSFGAKVLPFSEGGFVRRELAYLIQRHSATTMKKSGRLPKTSSSGKLECVNGLIQNHESAAQGDNEGDDGSRKHAESRKYARKPMEKASSQPPHRKAQTATKHPKTLESISAPKEHSSSPTANSRPKAGGNENHKHRSAEITRQQSIIRQAYPDAATHIRSSLQRLSSNGYHRQGHRIGQGKGQETSSQADAPFSETHGETEPTAQLFGSYRPPFLGNSFTHENSHVREAHRPYPFVDSTNSHSGYYPAITLPNLGQAANGQPDGFSHALTLSELPLWESDRIDRLLASSYPVRFLWNDYRSMTTTLMNTLFEKSSGQYIYIVTPIAREVHRRCGFPCIQYEAAVTSMERERIYLGLDIFAYSRHLFRANFD